MKYKLIVLSLLLGSLLLSSCMSTSFSGNYTVQSGEKLRGNLFVTSGSVTLEENSWVTGTILLTSGEIHIGKNAQVGKDVALTSGALYLADGAIVHGDVILANQEIDIHESPTSQVEGSINYNFVPYAVSVAIKVLFLYCMLPLMLLIGIILILGVWLGRTSKKRQQVVQTPPNIVAEDAQIKLHKLKSMLDEGLITEADYESKKTDILSKM